MNRALLTLLMLLVVVVACDDTENPCRPAVPAGQIKGRVSTGGVAALPVVSFWKTEDGELTGLRLETDCDLLGRYEMDVPAGDYVVSVRCRDAGVRYYHTGGSLSAYSGTARPLRIDAASSPTIVDFVLGGMVVTIDLPDRLENETIDVRVWFEDDEYQGSRYPARGSAVVQDGRLEAYVGGVLPGEHTVEFILGGSNGESLWLPGVRDADAATRYSVVGHHDDFTVATGAITQEPARLEGAVTGAWRELGLSAHPRVYVVDVDSMLVLGSQDVADDGTFGRDIYLPEPVKVGVDYQDVRVWIGGPDFDDATVFELEAGATISGVDLVQSGLFLRLAGPTGFSGPAVVTLVDPVTYDPQVSTFVHVYGGRDVGIANLWPGEFLMHVEPWPWYRGDVIWRAQWHDRATTADAAQAVTITAAGDVTTVDLVLEAGGVIRGETVFGAEAEEFYTILVTPADEATTWCADGSSRSDPGYEVLGLTDGDFKVGIVFLEFHYSAGQPLPEGVVWYPGVADWDDAEVLEIRDAGEVTGIDFQVP